MSAMVGAVDALIEIGLTPTAACRKTGLNIFTYYKRKEKKSGAVPPQNTPQEVNPATAQGYEVTNQAYPVATINQGGGI